MIYCSKCKIEDNGVVGFIKVSKSKSKQYYNCSPCNTERMRQYRLTDVGKKNVYKAALNYNAKNATRLRAWRACQYLGNRPCEVCGVTALVDKHHSDPSKPLDVVWLCRKHHKARHKAENELII